MKHSAIVDLRNYTKILPNQQTESTFTNPNHRRPNMYLT